MHNLKLFDDEILIFFYCNDTTQASCLVIGIVYNLYNKLWFIYTLRSSIYIYLCKKQVERD